ncbi:hypothetical protein F5X99DRAFT_24424 [Biscogniauxia marginata]|nr:hypothetical protein F5X99DRAFT_24424 [Biscogniauxia marginata]
MDLKTTTARLRRTFAYPSDSSTPSSPADADANVNVDATTVLDEQEQEDLIRALARQNESRNAQFRLFLLSVPLLSTIPYLLVLLHPLRRGSDNQSSPPSPSPSPSISAADLCVAVLGLSSLASTAWMLWALPPGVTGVRALDAWVAGGGGRRRRRTTTTTTRTTTAMMVGPMAALSLWGSSRRKRRGGGGGGGGDGGGVDIPFWTPGQQRSPLEQYLPFLNVALCAVLVLTGALSGAGRSAATDRWGHVGLGNLPAVVYAVVLAAKMVMGGVDPERELAGLRYDYKGA